MFAYAQAEGIELRLGQIPGLVGEYGGMPGARITLTDEETGDVLTSWPDEQ